MSGEDERRSGNGELLSIGKERQVHTPPSPEIQTQEWEKIKEGKSAQVKVSTSSSLAFLSQAPDRAHASQTLLAHVPHDPAVPLVSDLFS